MTGYRTRPRLEHLICVRKRHRKERNQEKYWYHHPLHFVLLRRLSKEPWTSKDKWLRVLEGLALPSESLCLVFYHSSYHIVHYLSHCGVCEIVLSCE